MSGRYLGNTSVAARADLDALWGQSAATSINVMAAPYLAVGDGVADDTAAIQAAINACPIYGSVVLPKGTYLISSGLLLTKPLTLQGVGFGSLLSVAAIMPNTTDVITIRPATDGHYFALENFAVALQSAGFPAGRHTIRLDASAHYIGDSRFTNLQFNSLGNGGNAIFGDGTGGGEGTLVLSTIRGCVIQDGINLQTCGDTVRILENHMNGANPAVDVAFVAGASTFVLAGNSITNIGGVHIGEKAVTLQIVGNEIETFNTFIGSNGALIDIDGTVGSPANDTIIARNSFQVVNGVTTNTIRVNHASRTNIYANRFGRGLTTSKDIAVTANAVDTIIGSNMWTSGLPVSSMLDDLGTTTMFASALSASLFLNTKLTVAAGASGVLTEQLRFNRTNDGNRYNSIFSTSNTPAAAANISVWVHDGVTGTSQAPCMMWTGRGFTYFLTMPPIYANNAAAIAGGLTAGGIYRNNADPDHLCVVH